MCISEPNQNGALKKREPIHRARRVRNYYISRCVLSFILSLIIRHSTLSLSFSFSSPSSLVLSLSLFLPLSLPLFSETLIFERRRFGHGSALRRDSVADDGKRRGMKPVNGEYNERAGNGTNGTGAASRFAPVVNISFIVCDIDLLIRLFLLCNQLSFRSARAPRKSKRHSGRGRWTLRRATFVPAGTENLR